MIKIAKLPQGRFTTQGGRTHGGRENIYYFKPFYFKNKAVCLGFLVIVARIKQ